METAMQQHIEWLKATLDLCKENAPTLVNCISLCISDAESRLEMEKEQIIDAYKAAEDKYEFFEYEHRYGREYLTAEPYYNETFKQ
jgi:hypothetical protein